MTLVVGLCYIYIPIEYKTVPVGRFKCPGSQGNTQAFHGIWSFIIYSMGPPIIMLIFGSLTIRNVQRTMRRVAPQNIRAGTQNQTQIEPVQQQLQRPKTTDRQLIQMMIAQCVYFSVMSTPLSIYWIYASATSNVVPDALQTAREAMFQNIAGYLSFTCASTSFYFFTLSSQLFRRELMHLFCRGRRPHG
jgi:DMSO/TMAO reductase YedYZ heme-binding membrane subunit